MVPAMDRISTFSARWIWIGVGLLLTTSEFGCAQLKSQVWGRSQTPAEIGQKTDTYEVYTQAHRTRSPNPSAGLLAGSSDPAGPQMVKVEEVGAAILPAQVIQDPSVSGVSLQPPMPIDPRPSSKVSSANTGVPSGSRILASAEPRSQTKPTASPAQLVSEARAALNALSSYEVSMHRQERVNNSLLPEEDVVLAIRREPKSVRLTWPSGPNQGREVLYRADEPGGQMHVKMANAALPRLSIAPESPMVMRNSRHPVTEAGFDSLVEALENAVKSPEASGIKFTGLETPAGFDHALQRLVRTTPEGETWRVDLDPQTHLPAIVEAVDAKGQLLERYVFRDVRPNLPELASADAFDANARWGPPRGLFGRFARANESTAEPSPR